MTVHEWTYECVPDGVGAEFGEAGFLARLQGLERQGYEIFTARWIPGGFEIVYRKEAK